MATPQSKEFLEWLIALDDGAWNKVQGKLITGSTISPAELGSVLHARRNRKLKKDLVDRFIQSPAGKAANPGRTTVVDFKRYDPIYNPISYQQQSQQQTQKQQIHDMLYTANPTIKIIDKRVVWKAAYSPQAVRMLKSIPSGYDRRYNPADHTWSFILNDDILDLLVMISRDVYRTEPTIIHNGQIENDPLQEKTYYGILQVDSTATRKEIKAAFRKQVKEHHPDKGGEQESFILVHKAYETLTNPVKKKKYDVALRIAPRVDMNKVYKVISFD